MSGVFFSFDGVDGVGKSTQLEMFCQWLAERGELVVSCRDPGGTQLGEALRQIVLHQHETPLSSTAELLIYMASRAQLVSEVIRPALAADQIVVSDRFLLANVAYQGHAGGVAVADAWAVGKVATGGLMPALTFLLDMPVEEAAGRQEGTPDRMEARGIEFQARVREGFLAEAQRVPERIVVIDASRDPAAVQTDVRAAAEALLASRVGGRSG